VKYKISPSLHRLHYQYVPVWKYL